MKPLIVLMPLYMIAAFTYGQQTKTFGIFTYKEPTGFELRENSNYLFYSKEEGKNYCQLFVYPVTQSAGCIETDFENYWNFFARNPSQKVGDPETRVYDSLNGWKLLFGSARGSYNGQMFAISLTAFTKNNFSYYTASVLTDKKFTDIAQDFTAEVVPDEAKLTQNNSISENGNNSTTNARSSPASTSFSTLYSDGWTSTYVGPYVTVSNGNTEAWIFPVNDSLDKIGRKPDELLEDRYWRYAVNRFFQVRNVAERPWQMSSTGSDKIFEAEVKNRQTGKENFVSMRVVWNSGRAQVVLAFAATKEQMYKSVFAQYNAFEQVLPYNKFVPTKQMLQGNWQSIETGATSSYSVAGGFQGGNTKVRFKDVFTFHADGTYQSYQAVQRYTASNHDGMGRNYKGQFSMEGETLQLTGRDKEDPGVFDCWMEAVQDGLALIMVNKKFTGQRYMLFRTK
jgi:hypothetical protein